MYEFTEKLVLNVCLWSCSGFEGFYMESPAGELRSVPGPDGRLQFAYVEWYTGSIIGKTQNPWTAMRGQIYDYYLDVNACLYGLRSGSEPLHVMFDFVENMVIIVNNTLIFERKMSANNTEDVSFTDDND